MRQPSCQASLLEASISSGEKAGSIFIRQALIRQALGCLLSICSHSASSTPSEEASSTHAEQMKGSRPEGAEGANIPEVLDNECDEDARGDACDPAQCVPTNGVDAGSYSLGPDHDLLVVGRSLLLGLPFSSAAEVADTGQKLDVHRDVSARLAVRVLGFLASSSARVPRATRDSEDKGRGALNCRGPAGAPFLDLSRIIKADCVDKSTLID